MEREPWGVMDPGMKAAGGQMWKESPKKRPRAERTPFPLAFRDLGGGGRVWTENGHPRWAAPPLNPLLALPVW